MRNRIHSHPKLEAKLGLDEEHVIIDRELYHEMLIVNSQLVSLASSVFPKKRVRAKSPGQKISVEH